MGLFSGFKHFKIRTKLFVLVSIVIGLISLFINIFYPAKFVKQATEAISSKAQSIATMTAFSLSAALYFEDKETIEEVFQSTKQNKDLVYIVVLDKSEKPVASFNKNQADQANFLEVKDNNYIYSDGMIFRIMKPILYRDQEIGQLYLGLSLGEVRKEIVRIRTAIAIQSFIIFIIGIIVLFSVSRIITRPLSNITETVERISKKGLTHRASVSTRDEVGQLANAFNRMVDNLESVYNELEDANLNLERRVNERTKELRKEILERKWAEEKITLALDEKEVLLHELYNRVKNSMQIISDLFEIQAKELKDEDVLDLIRDAQGRVKSISLTHEKLYRAKEFARVDIKAYLQSLTTQLFNSYSINRKSISLKINAENIFLNIDTAIPCGLIVNELISNSLKHAFPEDRRGEIGIDFYFGGENRFSLIVKDNGIGLPEDIDIQNPKTFGLKLVNILTRQLNGTLDFKREPETFFKIEFKEIHRVISKSFLS